MGRGIFLWLLGVPIPVLIILLLIFHRERPCVAFLLSSFEGALLNL
jgi:hypothetical protein